MSWLSRFNPANAVEGARARPLQTALRTGAGAIAGAFGGPLLGQAVSQGIGAWQNRRNDTNFANAMQNNLARIDATGFAPITGPLAPIAGGAPSQYTHTGDEINSGPQQSDAQILPTVRTQGMSPATSAWFASQDMAQQTNSLSNLGSHGENPFIKTGSGQGTAALMQSIREAESSGDPQALAWAASMREQRRANRRGEGNV